MACDVSSVPLSLTIVRGLPRSSTIRSSSRPIQPQIPEGISASRPDSDVSATRPRHSRVKSSTTARTGAAAHWPACPTRSPRTSAGSAPPAGPWASASRAPASGRPASGRPVCARRAAPRGEARTGACGSASRRRAPAGCAGAGSRTGAVHRPGHAAVPGQRRHPAAGTRRGRSSARCPRALGFVEDRRELITVAARLTTAVRLASILSLRMATRLNSFSLQK